MMSLIYETENGAKSYFEYINGLDINSSAIQFFIDNSLEDVLFKRDYRSINLLVHTLLRMGAPQIDLKWTETIRKNRVAIHGYLSENIAFEDISKASDDVTIKNIFSFLTLLLSSTELMQHSSPGLECCITELLSRGQEDCFEQERCGIGG